MSIKSVRIERTIIIVASIVSIIVGKAFIVRIIIRRIKVCTFEYFYFGLVRTAVIKIHIGANP